MDADAFRRLARGLPDVEEHPHHGFPSFRVWSRIFATLPDPDHAHLMLAEHDITAAVAQWPQWSEEKWWGGRLSALRVRLPEADDGVVAELTEDAWRARRGH